MTAPQVLQVAVACIATVTPWLVVRIAFQIATRHAVLVQSPFPAPPAVARLTRATALVLPGAVVAAFLLTPPSRLMGVIDVAAFTFLAVFGLRALGEIDAASRPARELTSTERTASLRPRRLGDYLPLSARLAPFIIATAGLWVLGWRLDALSSSRLFVPMSFILGAVVFLWLYEAWMREEISGDGSVGLHPPDVEAGRRRRVRQIFAMEVILVAGLLGAGHALLGLDWAEETLRVTLATVSGAVLGVIGCALAVSSELNRRRYRQAGTRHVSRSVQAGH
jgi:amino acid transporter